MTPGARVAAAISVLEAWLDGAPVERALTNWARSARYAGSKDRAAVRDHVFDVLRRKGSCAALGGDSGRGLMIGLLRAQGADPESLFTGEGHAPAALSEAERAPQAVPDDPWLDIPDWLRPVLERDLGPQAPGIIAAMRDRAPLYLRVNPRKASCELAEDRLSKDGLKTEKTVLETALKVVENPRRLQQGAAYAEGLVEIQDLSVQLACATVDWPRSGRILDYCAGGGGKTLAIAGVSDAALHAHDANPGRMTGLAERAARAGVRVRQVATAELAGEAPYDLVLCDVPCSGSGTWRRDPEAKWRLTPERLQDLGRIQREIVQQSQALVAPGGRLVYMTCSLLEDENEAVVRAAMERPGWELLQQRRFTPLEASDGFFLAEARRIGAPS